jgi:hypothetical protein
MREPIRSKSMPNLSPDSPTDTVGGLPTSEGVQPDGFYTSQDRDAKAVNLVDLSAPFQLVGRQAQFQRITQVLARDGDLLIVGVPGSGRRTWCAAQFRRLVPLLWRLTVSELPMVSALYSYCVRA